MPRQCSQKGILINAFLCALVYNIWVEIRNWGPKEQGGGGWCLLEGMHYQELMVHKQYLLVTTNKYKFELVGELGNVRLMCTCAL